MTVTTNQDTGHRDMQVSKTATLAQTNFLELSPDSEHAEKEPSAVAIHAESRRLASLRFILFLFISFHEFSASNSSRVSEQAVARFHDAAYERRFDFFPFI